ncbi:APC family permease (plasmid) [Rhodococcus opacus]|uniref:APC family permease n=1 Tax=Rhodococcus opacus TaxID=37919 RepID=UPI0034D31D66
MADAIIATQDESPERRMDAHQTNGKGKPRGVGTVALVVTVIAWLGPLSGAAGYAPLVIGFGNGLGAPLMFLAVGLVLIIFSIGYMSMVRQVPRPGAFYAYVSAGLGKRVGLGAGVLTTMNYLFGALGYYFYGGVATQTLIKNDFGIDLPWWAYAFGYLVVVTLCSYRGMAFNARILGVIVGLEVLIIMIFNVATIFRGGPTGYPTEPFTWDAFTSGPIAVAALFAISLYAGFESTAIYRDEARNPARTIPRATYLVVIAISVFYALTVWCLIVALGTDKVVAATAADSTGAFTTALTYSVGHSLAEVVTVLLITSILAGQISIANASTRYLHSFGVDRVLPRTLAAVHKRHGSPHRAAIANSALATASVVVFLIAGTDPQEVYAVFNGVAVFGFEAMWLLVSLAVFVYFRRNRDTGEPMWKVVVAPVISVACFGWLLYYSASHADLLLGRPTPLVPILFGVVGLAFVSGLGYASWMSLRRPEGFQRIGRDVVDSQER